METSFQSKKTLGLNSIRERRRKVRPKAISVSMTIWKGSEKRTAKDKYVIKALNEFWGLRIIRQEPWECLISYMCATYKSIAAIKHMLNTISKKYGKATIFRRRKITTLFQRQKNWQKQTISNLENADWATVPNTS